MIPGAGMRDGHKAIVTGGGSGIGEAICRRFAAEGARVAVLDRRVDTATEAAAAALGGIDHAVVLEAIGTGRRTALPREWRCGPPGARTRHLGIKSPLLYPMS